MPTVIGGDGAIEIALAKPIVLKNFDGSGERVGVEIVGVVADHAAKIGNDVEEEKVCW